MRFSLMPALLAGATLIVPASSAVAADPMSDQDMIKSAESAAPPAVGKGAKIVAFDAQMNMRTLREGSNGFTCVPDFPSSPGPDPMCADQGGMAWMAAWLGHKDPPKGVVGFVYMLAGGSDPSNLDPFATEPMPGGQWTTTPPHVMILNVGDMVKDYPTGEKPNTQSPYVMYPGTPYAHIMVPVKQ